MNNLTLRVVQDFQCLGNKCETSCCKRGWDIDIEPELLDRWHQLEDTAFKKKLLETIKVEDVNGEKVTRLLYDDNGECFHLDENGMCSIQDTLGAEFMPSTCDLYPRLFHEGESTSINSANMSCPEIARLVIENSDNEIFTKPSGTDHDLQQFNDGPNALENYLDKWTKLVLLESGSPISVRLYYIGRVINDLNRAAERTGLTEKIVIEACAQYRNDLKVISNSVATTALKADQTIAGWFWDIIYNFSDQSFSRLSNFYQLTDPLAKLNITNQRKTENDYRGIYSEIYQLMHGTEAAVKKLHPNLEKYLGTLFVNTGFPWNPIGGNFIASYIKVIFHFTSTWYLLALIANSKGSLEVQDLVRAIYHVEHDYIHYNKVTNTMRNNEALFEIGKYFSSLLDLK